MKGDHDLIKKAVLTTTYASWQLQQNETEAAAC